VAINKFGQQNYSSFNTPYTARINYKIKAELNSHNVETIKAS